MSELVTLSYMIDELIAEVRRLRQWRAEALSIIAPVWDAIDESRLKIGDSKTDEALRLIALGRAVENAGVWKLQCGHCQRFTPYHIANRLRELQAAEAKEEIK